MYILARGGGEGGRGESERMGVGVYGDMRWAVMEETHRIPGQRLLDGNCV